MDLLLLLLLMDLLCLSALRLVIAKLFHLVI